MAKGTSFAAKAKGKKKKSQTLVKYIKSVKSEKTGHWRFNEQMIALEDSENLDGALQRLKDETLALDMDLPNPEEKDEAVVADALAIEDESSAVAIEENVEVADAEEKNETAKETKAEEVAEKDEAVEEKLQEAAVEDYATINEKEEKSVEDESVEKVVVADEEKEENTDQSDETSKEKKTDE